MAATTGTFSELLYPGLKAIWGTSYKDYPEVYPKCGFRVESSNQAYEKTLSMTGFGLASVKGEGSSVTYDEAYQGYTQTLTHVGYGIGFQVTSEMYDDDQYGKIKALPKALAKSVRDTIEQYAANIYNNAFTSGTGPDGSYLCVTTHALIGGGTEQNCLSTAADLSMTSLEQAFIDIGDIVNDRALLANIKAQKLVIPPELEWTVRQILESDKDPESNYNAINPAKGIFPGGYVVNPWLTDADAWFIVTDSPYGLVFYWRKRPEFTKDNDFDSDNAKYKTTFRMSVGWDDWRGVYGTPGA